MPTTLLYSAQQRQEPVSLGAPEPWYDVEQGPASPRGFCYVDGYEKKTHRVNALFRSVELNPGAHRVVHRYQPTSFRLGV